MADQVRRSYNPIPLIANSRVVGTLQSWAQNLKSQKDKRRRAAGPLFAIFMTLGIIALFIVVVFKKHRIKSQKLSHIIILDAYSAVVPGASTLITAFITSQLQGMLARKLNLKLREPPSIDDARLKNLDSRFRTIFKVPSWHDRFQNKFIVILYFIASTATTSVFTGRLQPSFISENKLETIYFPTYSFDKCVGVIEANSSSTSNTTGKWEYNTTHSLKINEDYHCPYKKSSGLLALINPNTTNGEAYYDGSVIIYQNVIGVTSVLYGGLNQERLKIKSDSIWSTTTIYARVPVLTSNPVSCQENLNVSVDTAASTFTTWAELDDGTNCSVTFNAQNNSPVSNFCLQKDIGKAVIMWTSTGENAALLSAATGKSRATTAPGQYSVLCTVDTRSAFEVTWVSAEYHDYVQAGEDFNSHPTPDMNISTIRTPALYAAAYSLKELSPDPRTWPVKMYEPSKKNQTIFDPRNNFAFGSSSNTLEDVLGLLVGLTASRTGSYDFEYSNKDPLQLETVLVERQDYAIGGKGPLSILYTVPVLVLVITLICLLFGDRGEEATLDVTSLEQLLKYNLEVKAEGDNPSIEGRK